MWLLFGGKTKARRVKDGREGRRFCPDCQAITVFLECDVTDKVQVFFVDVAEHTTRRMVCSQCGEDLDIAEFFPDRVEGGGAAGRAGVAAPRPSSRLTGEKKQLSEASKDELLLALKRKMGKVD